MSFDEAAGEEAILLDDFSLEMTGKDIGDIPAARALLPRGTRVNVAFLGSEDLGMRLAAARAVREAGLIPVPHVAARRLESEAQLVEFLAALRDAGVSEEAFIIGGDPAEPLGPYPDAAAVIGSGRLTEHGVRRVGVAGYPEGHPRIPGPVLWQSLTDKAALLSSGGLAGGVITQVGFDAGAALLWVEQARQRGVTLPVRVGVAGPAGVRRLLGYASRFGVSTSAAIARKYGLSLTNLMSTAGPDKFIRDLARGYDPGRHGEVKLHFYTFGGVAATARWISEFSQAGVRRRQCQ